METIDSSFGTATGPIESRALVVRKLNLSSIHNSSAGGGEENLFELQNNNIDTVEQSPLKDRHDGHIENTEMSALDEVAIIQSPSLPATAEDDAKSSNDEMDEKETSRVSTLSQFDQESGNKSSTNVIDLSEEVPTSCYASNDDTTVSQKNPAVAKKLGHRDLREFAFKRRSERDKETPQNGGNLPSPSGNDTSRRPSRKIMCSEDFLCPLERKKHKIVAIETDSELEDTTVNLERNNIDKISKSHKLNTKDTLQSIKVQ